MSLAYELAEMLEKHTPDEVLRLLADAAQSCGDRDPDAEDGPAWRMASRYIMRARDQIRKAREAGPVSLADGMLVVAECEDAL